MGRLSMMVGSGVRYVEPCVHGGEVWGVSKAYGFSGGEVLDFSSNINPLGPPEKALEAIRASLWRIPYYPDDEMPSLKEAVSKYVGGVEPGNVVLGNGSTELIYLFAEVFIQPGDEVLIPEPTFGEYERACRRVGGKVGHVEPDLEFKVDFSRIVELMHKGVKAVFLCNPNNPTAALRSRDELMQILDEASRKDTLVFLDEDFIEFASRDRRFSLASEAEKFGNLFIIRSFTKTFGLTGLRIGYGVACEEIIELLDKARMPWSVNCLAEAAAIEALKDSEYLSESIDLVERERSFLFEELSAIKSVKPYPSYSNFIFTDIRGSGLSSSELKKRLLEHRILIRDCSSFYGVGSHHIRLAVRKREENMKLISALRGVLGG